MRTSVTVRRRFLLGGALLLLTACGSEDRGSSTGTAATGSAAKSLQTQSDPGPQGLRLWRAAREVPRIEFKDGQGRPLTLWDFRGKLVLLNIWATWCGPCREEMPSLDRLQTQFGSESFQVVALSIDQAGVHVVKDFYKKVQVTNLSIYIDETGLAASRLGSAGVPVTLLIDSEGREVGRLVGATKWDSDEMVRFLTEYVGQMQKRRT